MDRDIETALAWDAGQLALARLTEPHYLPCCCSFKRDERTGEPLHRRFCLVGA